VREGIQTHRTAREVSGGEGMALPVRFYILFLGSAHVGFRTKETFQLLQLFVKIYRPRSLFLQSLVDHILCSLPISCHKDTMDFTRP